jgi:hypothetical protein
VSNHPNFTSQPIHKEGRENVLGREALTKSVPQNRGKVQSLVASASMLRPRACLDKGSKIAGDENSSMGLCANCCLAIWQVADSTSM